MFEIQIEIPFFNTRTYIRNNNSTTIISNLQDAVEVAKMKFRTMHQNCTLGIAHDFKILEFA